MKTLHPLVAELRNRRIARGLTVTQLAARISTTAANVSHIEAGDSLPSLRTAEEIGAVLGLELTWKKKRKGGGDGQAELAGSEVEA